MGIRIRNEESEEIHVRASARVMAADTVAVAVKVTNSLHTQSHLLRCVYSHTGAVTLALIAYPRPYSRGHSAPSQGYGDQQCCLCSQGYQIALILTAECRPP